MNSFEKVPPNRAVENLERHEDEVTQETLNAQLDVIDGIEEKIHALRGASFDDFDSEQLESLINDLENAVNLFETDFHDIQNDSNFEVDEENVKEIEDRFITGHREWIKKLREVVKGMSIKDMVKDVEAPREGVADELLDEDTEEVEVPERPVESGIQMPEAPGESPQMKKEDYDNKGQTPPPMMMEGEDYNVDDDKPGKESLAA